MIIYDCHIPTMKVEPVMLDTSQCHIDSCSMSHRHDNSWLSHTKYEIWTCNVGYSCAMSHRHDNTWLSHTRYEVEPVMSDTLVQCHMDMIIHDCHTLSMKVEPVMSDTLVQSNNLNVSKAEFMFLEKLFQQNMKD